HRSSGGEDLTALPLCHQTQDQAVVGSPYGQKRAERVAFLSRPGLRLAVDGRQRTIPSGK
ncbi:MAG: hypothetical protein P8Y27_14345, partial [Chromatiaceae bacterium]